VHAAAVYRSDDDQASAFAAGAAADGLPVTVHRADLASVEACREVVTSISDRHGPCTRLVNNAGILTEAKVLAVTEELWDTTHDVNLRSAFFLAQAVWPTMLESGFGRIVNIGSVTASSGNPVQAAYGASKAGMVGLTRSLAMAGARKGITVNCVVPGVYETDMTNAMEASVQERIASMIPVGRRGRPEEMAHIVHSLVHEDAAYVTGAVLMADGGLGMGH
jgi:NAD(P)-dependent dehydrogenase (short-subunit alcohol dehydrogenase family)